VGPRAGLDTEARYTNKYRYNFRNKEKFRYSIPAYTDPFRAQLILSRNTRWTRLPRMAQIKNAHRIVVGNMKGKENLIDVSINGRIILKFILTKHDMRVWMDLSGSETSDEL
jgi:hypothetical protein